MASLYQWLCLFICLSATATVRKIEGVKNVTLTLIESAVSKGAVCLDGSSPGYYFDKGQGEGVNNWVIFLEGGGWCLNATNCRDRGVQRLGSSKLMHPQVQFGDLRSDNPKENPNFYNWNRIHVGYCDGSSYTGDIDGVDPITNRTFRGARVYDALMEEFLAKGMKDAKNVIFAGSSAGGTAVILHCDRFRALFPSTTRVKCLADSSYFINDDKLEGDKLFQSAFEYLVDSMGSAKWLPHECTSKMKPSLCFFPQYTIQYVKTPIFLTMSAFDEIQMRFGLSRPYENCVVHNNCTIQEMNTVQEQRLHVLSLLPPSNSQSIAIWINNCVSHEFLYSSWYGPDKIKVISNKTYEEVFADWYFDRDTSPIRAIERSEKPVNCAAFGQHPIIS